MGGRLGHMSQEGALLIMLTLPGGGILGRQGVSPESFEEMILLFSSIHFCY